MQSKGKILGGAESFDFSPDLGQKDLLVAVLDAFQIRQRHILEVRLRIGTFLEKCYWQLMKRPPVLDPLSTHSLWKQLLGASRGVILLGCSDS